MVNRKAHTALAHMQRVCERAKSLQSCPTLWTLQTIACQAPLSMGFSRQEYQSGLLCPPPGDLHNPGIKPESLMPPALVGRFFIPSATREEVTYEINRILHRKYYVYTQQIHTVMNMTCYNEEHKC